MKKIIGISVLGCFTLLLSLFIFSFIKEKTTYKKIQVLNNKKVIELFDSYKPLPELNIFIGSSVTGIYNYLKKNLENNCSVLYGKEVMDMEGIISVSTFEDDISYFMNEKNIQILCNDVKYKLFDKYGKPKEKKIVLMINVCNDFVFDYYLSTDLAVKTFGESPKIFNDWLKYKENYSSNETVVEKNIIEEEFLGITKVYEVEKKYWYHKLLGPIIKNDERIEKMLSIPYGSIFIEIANKKNIKDVNDKGINTLKFRSTLSYSVRAAGC